MPRLKSTPADPADEAPHHGAAAVQTVRSVPAASAPPLAASSPFAAGQAAKPQRAPRQFLDVSSVQIKTGVPLPPASSPGVVGVYRQLWDRLPVGGMVELNTRQAHGLGAYCKKAGAKYAIRSLPGNDVKGVWRLA